jgi:hypothetical protein
MLSRRLPVKFFGATDWLGCTNSQARVERFEAATRLRR